MVYAEHIQWIIDNRTEALTEALSQDNSYKTINNPLEVLLDADPTPKKKLTQWLVDTYINGGFKWEDIQSGSNSKVFDTLSLYIKHKSKLDSDNHIGQYDTLGSVYKDIAPFIKSEKSGRSAKRDEQAQAYEESEVLIKSDSLTVVIPKTEYASKWWGRGTQWCTASDKNNLFESYNKDGPLIIIIVNGIKTQLHVDLVNKNRSVQFMDEHDNVVKLNFIEDNWNLLKPVIKWALISNTDAFRYIPNTFKTPGICLDTIRRNGESLQYVPKDLMTYELCLEAVKQNSFALYYVSKDLKTEELCLEAVRKNGCVLEYVPEPLRTVELCLEAIKQNGEVLWYVPVPLRTSELCLKAVKQKGRALYFVPEHLRTRELCLEAVKQDGYALRYISQHLITEEICLEAVKQDGLSLIFVPEPLKTEKICLEAVRKSGGALGDVPEHLKIANLCLEAVKQNGGALDHVPEPLRTAELCLDAVKQDGNALCYVPEPLRTEEICLEAVKNNGITLFQVPMPLRTAELCLEAVRQNRSALLYVLKYLSKKIEELSIVENAKDNIKYDYSIIANELKKNILDNMVNSGEKINKNNYI